jgi:ComF family protein
MGQYDLITWVPVSQERRRKRGYAQAQLLAQATAAALGETAISTLEKVHNISAQSSLQDAKERWRNVRGVYRVPDKTLVVGKRVVLVDDIITTGATMEEASRTLKAAGATLVLGLALTQPYDSNDSCEVSL